MDQKETLIFVSTTNSCRCLCVQWQEVVGCSSEAERQQLCERLFQGGEEELGLLEALKLLMLARAVELHGCMQADGEVPLFCWLLFARDSSDCPRSFLSNHLSHVGLSAGLEQVGVLLFAAQQIAGVLRHALDVFTGFAGRHGSV